MQGHGQVRLIDARYAPVRELKSGGFGTVYLVADTRTRSRAALKFLSTSHGDALNRFRREARILTSLRENPYVVQILDHNLNHAPPYIVMEYCEGGSLREWVEERKTWREVAAALVHALLGLHGLHEAGGFHRDLKPDNLLVAVHPDLPGHLIIKVGDWGLARAPGSRSPMTRHLAGTHGYIAPEILQGGAYDARADIFSLGAVGSELLTGDAAGQSLSAARIPERLRSVIRQMLSHAPATRPSASAIAHALLELLNTPDVAVAEEPVDSGPPIGAFILGGLLFTGVVAALAALAGDDVRPAPPAPKPRPPKL